MWTVVDLPAPFGPEEAVDLARAHLEVDSVDRADAALELTDEAVDLDPVGARLDSVPARHPDSPSGVTIACEERQYTYIHR